jgi:hypothetical protein
VSDKFPSAFSEFPIGSQIAGYRLEEQIGRGGMEITVADSNPNHVHGGDTLTLVSTQRAPQGGGSAAVLGFLPSGQTPREFGLAPGGTLLVTDNSSGQLQAIDTGSLP